MPFEEGLFYYLDNYEDLAEEVDNRIWPTLLPQDPTLPAIVYTRISTPRLYKFEDTFLPQGRFQFDCYAEEFQEAKNVAADIKAALDLYSGSMGDYTVETCIIEDEMDIYEPETGRWRSMVEVVIWYLE
jgi:hypothetical protein